MLPEPTDPRGRVELEAARVVARLSALGLRRSPPTLLRTVCAELARLAWSAERVPGPVPPIDVAPHGWPDVLRVLVADLLAVPGQPDELADGDELAEAADLLTALRRELP